MKMNFLKKYSIFKNENEKKNLKISGESFFRN